MRITRALAALPLAFVLAACGGNSDVTQSSGDDSAQSADQSGGDGGPSTDDTRGYFEAISQLDQDALAEDLKNSVPGSPAAAYVRYNSAVVDAALDAGASESDLPDASFKKVDGGYESCASGKCAAWTDIKAQGSKIANFSVNDKPLGDIILAGGKRQYRAGNLASAKLIAAYESQQGNQLNVVLNVSSKSDDLTLGAYTATYRSKSGRQSTASSDGTVSGSELSANSNSTVVIAFPRAELGGTLKLEVFPDNGTSTPAFSIPLMAAG